MGSQRTGTGISGIALGRDDLFLRSTPEGIQAAVSEGRVKTLRVVDAFDVCS